MESRPTPFDVAFGGIASERFPALAAGLTEAGRDPRDRDAFVLVREVAALLRDLHPEDAPGESVAELVALCQAAFLFWRDGRRVVTIGREALTSLLASDPVAGAGRFGAETCYLALPAHRVWGEVTPGAPAEPLDGLFVLPGAAGLDLVAVFGMQPGRPGFTVVTASGPRRRNLRREDASPLFSSRLPGAASAGLFQVAGPEELLELAFRAAALLPPDGPAAGETTVTVA